MIPSPCKQVSMESFYGLWAAAIFGFVALLACNSYLSWIRIRRQSPPGPFPFPVVGSLHLLGSLPHQSFASLAKVYGPIMYLRLGTATAIVVSSASVAREVLDTHDRLFASRPRFEAGRLFYDHLNVAFMPYGPRWRQMRRIYSLQLFTMKKLNSFQYIREEEMSHMLQSILTSSEQGKPLNFTALVSTLAINTIIRVVTSKKMSGAEYDVSFKLMQMVQEVFRLSGVPVISDFLPYLRWLDFKGHIERMKRLNRLLDGFLEDVLTERRKYKKEYPSEVAIDFLDVLLSISDDEIGVALDNEAIKAVILELLGAGTDTSSATIEWAMSELLRNPSTLRKLQQELDSHVGLSRRVLLSDLPHLHYLQAIVKETFRLHPSAPLLVPRLTTEACNVAGYAIPKDARVFVNVWAIGRDASLWENALEFDPSRFIGSNIDVRGKDFELLPFGGGRRGCPGLEMGLTTVQFTIASAVHSFEWSLASGESPKDLDMGEEMGIIVHRAKPLILRATPRLVYSE